MRKNSSPAAYLLPPVQKKQGFFRNLGVKTEGKKKGKKKKKGRSKGLCRGSHPGAIMVFPKEGRIRPPSVEPRREGEDQVGRDGPAFLTLTISPKKNAMGPVTQKKKKGGKKKKKILLSWLSGKGRRRRTESYEEKKGYKKKEDNSGTGFESSFLRHPPPQRGGWTTRWEGKRKGALA